MLDKKIKDFIDEHARCDGLFYDDDYSGNQVRRILCDECDDTFVDFDYQQHDEVIKYADKVDANLVNVSKDPCETDA